MDATPERPLPRSPLGRLRVALLAVSVGLPMAFICQGGGSGTTSGGTGTPAPPPRLKAVQDYTTACLKAIHLDPAKDLLGPWECQDPKAHRLELRVGGKSMDIGVCTGSGCPKEGDPTLSACDYPTWLDDKCYGNSYVQEVPTSNPKVTAVLLCRHKFRLSNKRDNFDDIAIIAHNSGNGETCWLQAEKSGGLDGKVHGPLSPQVKPDFWFHPDDTQGVYCVKCHDNGPFMNSRWMRNTITLEDSSLGPYKNSTPPFDTWKRPTFVELEDAKDEFAGAQTCTFCHKIAAGLVNADPDPAPQLGGRDFNTCKTWIPRSTGKAHPRATAEGKTDKVTYWMPDMDTGGTIGTGYPKADWEKDYRKHVDKLTACCREMGKKLSGLPATLPDGCIEMKTKESCPMPEVGGKCPVPVPGSP